jgi:biotin transporter BioY
MRSRAVEAAAALLLGVAFCFVMYWWQLRYEYPFHGWAANLVFGIPFAALAAMVVGGMSLPAAALGWLVLAVLTGSAYVDAATSSSSTASIAFVAPFIPGLVVVSLIFAVDHILRQRRKSKSPTGAL